MTLWKETTVELLRQRKNCGGGGKEEINETQWDVPIKRKNVRKSSENSGTILNALP